MDWNKFNIQNSAFEAIPGFDKIRSLMDTMPKLPHIEMPKMHLPPNISALKFNTKLSESLNDEREQIDEIVVEAYYNSDQISHFKNSIRNNPECSNLVSKSICIAIFLSIFCIAVPLLVLPINHDLTFIELLKHIYTSLLSIKGLFVTVMTTLVCGIFIVFLVKNNSMKYSQQDFELLEEWSELSNYSEYLKNYVENTSNDDSDDNN